MMNRLAFFLVLCFFSYSIVSAGESPPAEESTLDEPEKLHIDQGRTEGILEIFDDAAKPLADARPARRSSRRSARRRRSSSGSIGMSEKPISLTMKIASFIAVALMVAERLK